MEFEKYKKEINKKVEKIKKRIKKELEKRKYIKFNKYLIKEIEKEIEDVIIDSLNIKKAIIEESIKIELPPPHLEGDLTFNTFDLAKKLNIESNKLANNISEVLIKKELKFIENFKIINSFINLKLKKEIIYPLIVSQIISLKNKYGESDINAKKIAVIEYSSPNIAKPIGVGHLRSTIIGQVLANIYSKTGFIIIKLNHLGDWGTQFGELIYAYQNWGDKNKISKDPIRELKNLYVRFHKEAKEKTDLREKAREIFNRLEKKDEGLIKTWKKFKDLSIKEFKKTYKKLGIEFDAYIGESYFTDLTNEVIKDCLDKNLCQKEEKTEAISVKIDNLPSFLLQKQDGSSLYISRDLASLKFRIKNFKPQIILYVVGKEQELHFKQLFTLAQKLNYLKNTVAKHIDFGLILIQGKKMSTREGVFFELEDLFEQTIEKSKEIIKQKNQKLNKKEIEEISKIIGIGAIIYNDLKQSRIKNISFDLGRMLSFESGSAVYLQYTYVRINSILKKLDKKFKSINTNKILFKENIEFNLAKKLMFFPLIIKEAQKLDSPHLISDYLEKLAQIFNKFYDQVSIIKTEEKNLLRSRIALIKAVSIVIKNGLEILNIKVPEKM